MSIIKPDRFWSKVRILGPDDCWNWTASTVGNKPGFYGQISTGFGEPPVRSNRVAWELTYGEIPPGLQACHKCDNPSCCNPRHLFLGTNLDNIRDKVRKNRVPRGDSHCHAKLTYSDVAEMRMAHQFGADKKTLAELYGMHETTVGDILRCKHWISREI